MASPNSKSNLAAIVAYLKTGQEGFEKHLDLKNEMVTISACMAFKNWGNISLAGGWLITSYTPAEMFLTFDHYIGIFDLDGKILKKIHSQNTQIEKI